MADSRTQARFGNDVVAIIDDFSNCSLDVIPEECSQKRPMPMLKSAERKRKYDDLPQNNQNQQQQNRRQNTSQGLWLMPAINSDKKQYERRSKRGVCGWKWLSGGTPRQCRCGYVPSKTNLYDLILFDTGADRSFVSTAFSTLLDIVPNILDHGYNIELADGRIIGVSDGDNWHGLVVKKLQCVMTVLEDCSYPLQDATILIVRGDGGSERTQDGLNIFSFLYHVKDFPVVIPEDFGSSSSDSKGNFKSIVPHLGSSGLVCQEERERRIIPVFTNEGSRRRHFEGLLSELIYGPFMNFKLCRLGLRSTATSKEQRRASEDNIGVVEERGSCMQNFHVRLGRKKLNLVGWNPIASIAVVGYIVMAIGTVIYARVTNQKENNRVCGTTRDTVNGSGTISDAFVIECLPSHHKQSPPEAYFLCRTPILPPFLPTYLRSWKEREPEVTKVRVQSEKYRKKNIQPLVVQIQAPIDEPVVAPKPKPFIPYPLRSNKEKLREKDDNLASKFVEIFRELHFELNFADALLHIPKFASMFESLLNNKEKLFHLTNTPVNENCSAVILKKLLEKLRDPDKFLIPCDFPEIVECLALADLGASINLMPLSIWKKLSLPELTPTRLIFELADRSTTSPSGIAEDVFVKVGKFHLPADFIVVDYVVDPRVPLILGRPFLRSYPFYFFPSLTPFEGGDFILEEIKACLTKDSIPPGINDADFDPKGDLLLLEKLLNDDPSAPLPSKELHFEEIKTIKSSIDDPSELELKDLPSHLEYAFLEGTDKLPVVISKELKDEEKAALLKVLKSHKWAIAWKISDIKTIVYTDHSALKYLLAKQDAKPRFLWWILLLKEFDVIIRDKKGAENLAADHLSRLENPYQSDLEKREITEIFPLETLGMVTFRGDSSTPWFADIANYHARNFIVKGMSSQQKKKIL
ncbi:reverse transcriptase domain-containing protein [Tanacetum coccineum]|uniref:Reverse transcriptase domain-containing protein n=1 Tax=Tanacetum coccineum TaxID=301880 RepID=A0ABQ5CXQ8_9ASTR